MTKNEIAAIAYRWSSGDGYFDPAASINCADACWDAYERAMQDIAKLLDHIDEDMLRDVIRLTQPT